MREGTGLNIVEGIVKEIAEESNEKLFLEWLFVVKGVEGSKTYVVYGEKEKELSLRLFMGF